MKHFVVGSRWISEAEPELGLGLIVEVQSKSLTIFFPGAKVDRRYGMTSAPLKRIRFQAGDEIKTQDQTSYKVEEVLDEKGLLSYKCGAELVSETQLSDALSFSRPEERLMVGSVDSNELFKLRYDIHLNQRKLSLSPVKGFLGGRVSLIPHQFYVANEIAQRSRSRVMLADEVGLGKTIEAGLILHQQLQTGRVERVLIIVPDSLVYQWLIEMLRKFELRFKTINHETKLESGENPFEDDQLFIVSLKYLTRETWLMDHVTNSQWDMLIVDEAHQLRWSPEDPSLEYDLVSILAERTPGLLLLSGTPEILGLAGHFARLKLLDPHRFYDYDDFIQETLHYQEASEVARFLINGKKLTSKQEKKLTELGLTLPHTEEEKKSTLQELIDRHGTGRVYFRNTRQHVAKLAEFFPKRVAHAYPLKLGTGKAAEKLLFLEKMVWLARFLEETKTAKTLLICHDRDLVLEIEKKLKDLSSSKVATFHSGMTLVIRDRQAAYFADPEGAQILVSTEIGSEGRNFEFASHLILFDLPKLPDLLEQRIGRLDRIGQKNDINIHIPYETHSPEEVLYRWYHEGLNAFERSPKGASELYANVREELVALLQEAETGEWEEKKLSKLIKTTLQLKEEIEEKLENGQDLLIELNSFAPEKSAPFLQELRAMDESADLKNFMFNIFEKLGVDQEELEDEIYFARPGDNMYLPHFPGLPSEGLAFTCKRSIALKREEITFLTWDHPMVTGIMEFIRSKEVGTLTLASWKGKPREPFLFEAFYMLECVTEKKLDAAKYFPPTPLRVLINNKMIDFTGKISKKTLDDEVNTAPLNKKEDLAKIPKDILKECLGKTKQLVSEKAKQYKEQFKQEMLKNYEQEIHRLEELRKINSTVNQKDIEILKQNQATLTVKMDQSEVYLDSIRLIF